MAIGLKHATWKLVGTGGTTEVVGIAMEVVGTVAMEVVQTAVGLVAVSFWAQ